MKKLLCLIAVAFTLLPTLVFAHPGHGETEGFSIIHYMLEPGHLFLAIAGIALVSVLLFRRKKANK